MFNQLGFNQDHFDDIYNIQIGKVDIIVTTNSVMDISISAYPILNIETSVS